MDLPNNNINGEGGVPLKTFDLFPKLVLDLRLLIWEAALPDTPRLINLMYHRGTSTFGSRTPSLLHACQESREIALTHYKAFTNTTATKVLYLCPRYDTILIGNHCCEHLCDQTCRSRSPLPYHNFTSQFVLDLFFALAGFEGVVSSIDRLGLGWIIATAWHDLELWRKVDQVEHLAVCWDSPPGEERGICLVGPAVDISNGRVSHTAATVQSGWAASLKRGMPTSKKLNVEVVEVLQSSLLSW